MSVSSPRFRAALSAALVVLALVAAVGPSVGHRHEGGALGHAVGDGVSFSPGAIHPDAPAHVEGTRPIEIRPCQVCMLRAQSRGGEIPAGAVGSVLDDGSFRPGVADPRIASLGTVGPPASRGPPSRPVVS